MYRFATLLAFGICLLAGSATLAVAAGDEGSEEDLLFLDMPMVITASKKKETIKEAPAVVTVITAEEIQDFGANTFYDVLQRMPSIQPVGTHLYPRNTAVIRGDLVGPYDNHVLILINGRPFRDGISGGLSASFYNSFPVEVIERIEYVRGPGAVLYGSDAFDGVINIITKKPAKEIEAEITTGAGSFNANTGKGTFGRNKGDLSLLANVNYLKNDGWDFKATSFFPATAARVDGETKYSDNNVSGSVFLQYKDFTFNCFLANLIQGNMGINPAWQGTGTEGRSWLTTYRRFADVGYGRDLTDNYRVQANVTYNYEVFEFYSLSSLSSSEGASDILGEISLSGSLGEKANFIIGSVMTNLRNEAIAKAKIVNFDKKNYAGYLQLDYKLVEKLKIVGGAQYNKPEDVDGVTVPRVGATYQFTDKIGTKVSYAEAFRSPWPVETLTNFPGVLVGNPALTPEKVKTIDVQFMYNTSKSQSSLTAFDNSYTDLITRVAHPTIANTSSYANVGKMGIQGVEIESKVSLTSSLYVEGSGTYQSERDNKILTPSLMFKAGFSYHTSFGLQAGIFDNYFGEPRKNTGSVLNPEAKAVHLMSVNLTYTIPALQALKFNVFVQNALDQAYYYPEFSKNWVNTLPLESGRAVSGSVTYKF
jgi:outer membrane receptor for ferrienterochelin and colicins